MEERFTKVYDNQQLARSQQELLQAYCFCEPNQERMTVTKHYSVESLSDHGSGSLWDQRKCCHFKVAF